MGPEDLIIETELNDELADELTTRLIEFNRQRQPSTQCEVFEPAPIHLFVRDEEGKLVGGLTGRTHTLQTWLEITVLWVEQDRRGQGLGRLLVEQAERLALQRGCLRSRLSTGAHQAPGFYQKLGYVLYGELRECPPGDVSYYFEKRLGGAQPS